MFATSFRWLLGLAIFVGAVAHASAQEFFLKKGDTVVMMGDSITEQRLYSTYVEIWCQTRFPAYNLTFRNVGIGGDRSTGGNARFKRDVLPHKPTVLTVDFGMNDGNYQWVGKIVGKDKKEITEKNIESAYAVYMKGHQGIADQAKAANIRVAWVTPQPVEHNPGDANEQYNKTLEKYSAGVSEIAKSNGGLFVDQFHPYWAVIKKARDAGEKGRITGGDAVHPGPAGQALMAFSILKELNFPAIVSGITIDIGKESPVSTVNCAVFKLVAKPEGVSFERHDRALPYFPEQAKSILKWAPILDQMNRYGLKVTGLKPGKYQIKYDGKKIAEYTDQELAASVNFAAEVLAVGPVADQVKDIVKAINEKTNYYHDQIYSPLVLGRNIGPKNPDFKDVAKEDVAKHREKLIQERMKKMPELDAAIRKALEPRPHLVEIVPVK